jgi:DsbC/DsbD-like thiol-disulfide interchange protein
MSRPFQILIAAISLVAAATHPPTVRTAHARTSLIATVSSIAPGDSFTVALRIQPDSGWHVYWSNPGDAGMPPSLEWKLPKDWTQGLLVFPTPTRFETPPLASYGYQDDVWYPMTVFAGVGDVGPRVMLRARAEWLICREECLPEAADFTVALAMGQTVSHARNSDLVERFARANLPQPHPHWNFSAAYEDSVVVIAWDVPSDFNRDQKPYFFPATQGVILHAAAQTFEVNDTRAHLTIKRDDVLRLTPDTLRGVLVLSNGETRHAYTLGLEATRETGFTGQTNLLAVLVIGLLSLAGLILIVVMKRPHVSGTT